MNHLQTRLFDYWRFLGQPSWRYSWLSSLGSTKPSSNFGTCHRSNGASVSDHIPSPSWSFRGFGSSCGTCFWRKSSYQYGDKSIDTLEWCSVSSQIFVRKYRHLKIGCIALVAAVWILKSVLIFEFILLVFRFKSTVE
jgi:hypothetical protein